MKRRNKNQDESVRTGWDPLLSPTGRIFPQRNEAEE
jgi:hypothetical protein